MQRTPVIYQAGSSGRGQTFAGRHAECIFISSQSKDAARKLVPEARKAATDQGRTAAGVKVFRGLTVVVARTESEAWDLFNEYVLYASPEAGLAHFSSGTGIDFSGYGMDEPIRAVKNNAIESLVKTITNPELEWTKRKLLNQLALGGRYATVVGSPSEVADAMEEWVRETDIDGFNLTRTVSPESFEAFVDLVIPELQQRGIYKTAYAEGTLREKIFGNGNAHLSAEHIGRSFRSHAHAAV